MTSTDADRLPPASSGGYRKSTIWILAILQFMVVLDFAILSPLGPVVMPELSIGTARFGFVVSAYAVSAGISGLLTAGFADRFDRKRLLLFFYAGFLLGTLLCGIAPNYPFLLGARVVAGLFGGVITSINLAIVADLVAPSARGRAMGTIQSAFAASQVMGIPAGLFLANHFGWRGPFRVIALLGAALGILAAWKLPPVRAHLSIRRDRHPLVHLVRTALDRRYMTGFAATMLTATGGYMLQPFASNFAVHNLGIAFTLLPAMYMAAGLTGMVAGPLAGRLADRRGKFPVLAAATAAAMVAVAWWSHLESIPFWAAIVGNCLLFACINARIVTTMALNSAVPSPPDRGAYMAVSSSMQQFSGAVSAAAAGMIVVQEPSGRLDNYPTLGWVVVAAMALTVLQMRNVNRMVSRPQP